MAILGARQVIPDVVTLILSQVPHINVIMCELCGVEILSNW